MSKYFGKIGFATNEKISPGVYKEIINEKDYYGDIIRNINKIKNGDKVNNDIELSNNISIIADNFAITNFHNIRYVIYMNVKWKVSSVEIQLPRRLILSLGGIYNE